MESNDMKIKVREKSFLKIDMRHLGYLRGDIVHGRLSDMGH